MVYVDVVRKDHTGKDDKKVARPLAFPARIWRWTSLYVQQRAHKAHLERVRLFEPRMRHLKLGPRGEFTYLDSTENPIVEIFPEDSDAMTKNGNHRSHSRKPPLDVNSHTANARRQTSSCQTLSVAIPTQKTPTT